MMYYDQLQRPLNLTRPLKRIVSLVPSQTELLIDLGLANRLVGVTKFCVHPQNIRKEKAVVGGTKKIHYEKIAALNPDIILCNKEENTQEIVSTLAQTFTVHVSNIETLEDTYNLITQYGTLFSVEECAQRLLQKIKKEYTLFEDYMGDKPTLKVAYFIWRNPWMVAGSHTFVDYLLKLNRLENVYADTPRYPEIDLQMLKKTDVLLLSSEPFPFGKKHKKELLTYAKNARIAFVDGEFFSWYGSRLTRAFSYFKNLRKKEF